jgi:hypothetical protein
VSTPRLGKIRAWRAKSSGSFCWRATRGAQQSRTARRTHCSISNDPSLFVSQMNVFTTQSRRGIRCPDAPTFEGLPPKVPHVEGLPNQNSCACEGARGLSGNTDFAVLISLLSVDERAFSRTSGGR